MENKYYGYMGKLLRVDLDSRKITVEEPDESYYKHYLGGEGFIIHTLLTEIPAHADPLGPENKLVFTTGPLTGTKLIGTGRCGVGSKSPLTGFYGEAEAGGSWGVELKRAGYDAIIISGKAKEPVYLWIHNDAVEIRDAAAIWGKDIGQATAWFQEDLNAGHCSSAVIGPAGERMVHFASIVVDYAHTFGRCGMGAVMGSKGLKAVVVKGDGNPRPANPDLIKSLNLQMKGKYKNTPFFEVGTGSAMKVFESVGNLPIRNYRGGRFPNVEKIDAKTLMKTYGVGRGGCFNCPIRCKKNVRIEEGPWNVDPLYGGPEYETLASFGSNLLIDDLRAICKAHELCNRFGMDTISTGATIAFAMECFENGILTTKETDGLELCFGDAKTMIEILEKIALRKGVGDLLSRGTKQAAEMIGKGAMQYAIHVKGLEVPFHDPRYQQGLGLHYSLHGTGADHCSGMMDSALMKRMKEWESLGVAENMDTTELSPRKARMAYELGLWRKMPNYLGFCVFVPWEVSEQKDAYSGITGWTGTTWKLMKAVERGMTMIRLFNLREGLTRDDDRLPDRFYSPSPEGPLAEISIDPKALSEAQEAFYHMMGWDDSGIPTKGCLVGLDIEWAIPILEEIRQEMRA